MARLKVVFTSASFTEAHSVRALLEGNEIDAVVLDDHLIAQNPVHYGGALGFIKVAVPEDQVPKVKDVFKEFLGETAELPVAGKSFHPFTDIFRAGQKKAEPPAELVCSECGAKCDPDADFCDQCAAPVVKKSSLPEPAEPAPGAQTCPHCRAVLDPHKYECPGCGFKLRLLPRAEPALASERFPKAKSRCGQCGLVYTKAQDSCPECGGGVLPLRGGELLCPERRHVVEKAEGCVVCRGCKAVWLSWMV